MILRSLIACLICISMVSCGNDGDAPSGQPATKKDTTAKETPPASPAATTRAPIINITDTLSSKQIVLYMKDSASSVERISNKLAAILSFKLDAVIKKNKLKATGPPIAWYKSEKAPYFFEAGLPVDKKPAKLPSNVMMRETGVDSVVVAHFYGPYELLPQAYEALRDWVKDHHKKPNGAPYEVYVGDPIDQEGKPVDPYKVQTDVIFPWK